MTVSFHHDLRGGRAAQTRVLDGQVAGPPGRGPERGDLAHRIRPRNTGPGVGEKPLDGPRQLPGDVGSALHQQPHPVIRAAPRSLHT